jgi:hypothetical protein
MAQWLLSLSKGARVGLLVSIVWLIVVAGVSLGAANDGYNHNWGTDFCVALLLVGALPVAIGWGIRYIRRTPH